MSPRMEALLIKLHLKKPPVIIPTLETRLTVAQYQLTAATNMFQQAHAQLNQANGELATIAAEADAEAARHLKLVADAQAQVATNTKVMTKLQEFLP